MSLEGVRTPIYLLTPFENELQAIIPHEKEGVWVTSVIQASKDGSKGPRFIFRCIQGYDIIEFVEPISLSSDLKLPRRWRTEYVNCNQSRIHLIYEWVKQLN